MFRGKKLALLGVSQCGEPKNTTKALSEKISLHIARAYLRQFPFLQAPGLSVDSNPRFGSAVLCDIRDSDCAGFDNFGLYR
jgi:hypothetical protein